MFLQRIILLLSICAVTAIKHCIEPLRTKWVDTCDTPKVKTTFCHGKSCGTNQQPQTDTCTLVTHSLLADYSVFDIVFLHSGHCQAELSAGDLTEAMTLKALPYNENLVGIQINGSELLAALEHGFDLKHGRGVEEASPRLAGIRFRVSPRKDYGQRISAPEILSQTCRWRALDPAQVYNVLTTESLTNGAYRYTELRSGWPRTDIGIRLTDAFYDHAKSVCEIRDPFRRPKPPSKESTKATTTSTVNASKPLYKKKQRTVVASQ